jgi:hypothetical protein
MHQELNKLAGGDRHSIEKSNEVVADVIYDPTLFGLCFKGCSTMIL